MNKWSTQDFQDSKTTMYGTIMVGTCLQAFVQTPQMYKTKSEP